MRRRPYSRPDAEGDTLVLLMTFPRTYRVKSGWRFFLLGSALLFGVPSLYGLWYLGLGRVTTSMTGVYCLLGICITFLAGSVYLALTTLRSKIVLYADRIEVHELTRTHTLRRDEIAGWRLTGQGFRMAFVLERRSGPNRKVSTSWVYQADSAFDEWFADLDNLDTLELESAIDEVAEDTTHGADVQERFHELNRAKQLARILNFAGGGLCLWGFFKPAPYELVIILLMFSPWVAAAVAWRFGGMIQFDARPNDIKPNLAILVLLPMLTLALRAVLDYQTVGWAVQSAVALAIGTALFIAQYVCYPDLRAKSSAAVIAFLFSFAAYGYGAAQHINALADSSDIRQTRYVVGQKYVSKGRITTYKVKLIRANPSDPEVESAEVTQYFHEMLKPGDPVCLAFRPGALGVQWFSAGPCPPGTP